MSLREKVKAAVAVGGAVIGGLLMSGSAVAADLGDSKYIPPPPPLFVWTGWYVGLSAGGTWADIDGDALGTSVPPEPPFANFGGSFDASSFRGGIYGGYNWQFGQWVTGVEADIAWADGSESRNVVLGLDALPGDRTEVEFGWDAGIRLRLGYLLTPTALLYATGGIAWQSFEVSAIATDLSNGWSSDDETATGWTIGAGIETLVSDQILARLEYRYTDFGSQDVYFFEPGLGMDFDRSTQMVLVGLAYKY